LEQPNVGGGIFGKYWVNRMWMAEYSHEYLTNRMWVEQYSGEDWSIGMWLEEYSVRNGLFGILSIKTARSVSSLLLAMPEVLAGFENRMVILRD
jgi:hypothetical protein